MIILVLSVYAALCFGVFLGQRRLLYHPYRLPYSTAIHVAKRCGFEPWLNSSGQCIGWKQLARTRNPAPDQVLVTHGNAGSAIDRVDYATGLQSIGNCDVYLLEYPGYGSRSGSPSQKSLFAAASEAIALIEKDGSVYLIGESLGSGVAAYLAGTHPANVKGALLVAPYHNLTDVARHHMPIFPVSLMVLDRFPAALHLSTYHGPVAVLLAGQDQIVPNRFGRRLFESYSGPKRLWEIPNADHNDLPNQPASWWKELAEFWKE